MIAPKDPYCKAGRGPAVCGGGVLACLLALLAMAILPSATCEDQQLTGGASWGAKTSAPAWEHVASLGVRRQQLGAALGNDGQSTIASVSADRWMENDGFVIDLSVTIGSDTRPESVIHQEIDAVSLAEPITQTREVLRPSGTIRVL